MRNFLRSLKEGRIHRGLKRRAPACVEDLFELYADELFRYALTITRRVEDAEEILQRFFLKIVRNLDLFEQARNLRAYLYKSIRNEALNLLRDTGKECSLDDHLLEIPEEPGRHEEAISIEEALKSLPPEQREIILLKVYEGMKFREIAGMLGVSQDTVASRYRYALDKLRRVLGGRNE